MIRYKTLWLFAAVTVLLSCGNPKTRLMTERIKISGLKSALTKLNNGQTEFNFIGITSNGIDCIYFINEKGNFNIEFEAMVEEQIPFIEKFKGYAISKNYKFVMTTYKNKPKYKSNGPALVIRIETNSSLDEITMIGTDIEKDIFKNNIEIVYDIVP
jgi:hypothetical protein